MTDCACTITGSVYYRIWVLIEILKGERERDALTHREERERERRSYAQGGERERRSYAQG